MHGLRIQQSCLVNALSIPRFQSLDLDFSEFVSVRVFFECGFSACLSVRVTRTHATDTSSYQAIDRSNVITLCSGTHVHRSTTRCLVGRIVPLLRVWARTVGPEGNQVGPEGWEGQIFALFPLPTNFLSSLSRWSSRGILVHFFTGK